MPDKKQTFGEALVSGDISPAEVGRKKTGKKRHHASTSKTASAQPPAKIKRPGPSAASKVSTSKKAYVATNKKQALSPSSEKTPGKTPVAVSAAVAQFSPCSDVVAVSSGSDICVFPAVQVSLCSPDSTGSPAYAGTPAAASSPVYAASPSAAGSPVYASSPSSAGSPSAASSPSYAGSPASHESSDSTPPPRSRPSTSRRGRQRPGSGLGSRGKLRPRFTFDENMILMQEVVAHWEKLYGTLAQKTSSAQKSDIWESIRRKICATSGQKRDVITCKKRFDDIKRRARDKMLLHKKHTCGTGGGPQRVPGLQEYHYLYISKLRSEVTVGISAPGLESDSIPTQASAPELQQLQHVQTQSTDVETDLAGDDIGTPPKTSSKMSRHTPLPPAEVDDASGLATLHLQEALPAAPTPHSSPASARDPASLLVNLSNLILEFQSTQGKVVSQNQDYHQAKLDLLRQQVNHSAEWPEHILKIGNKIDEHNELSRQQLQVSREQVGLMQEQLVEMKRLRFTVRRVNHPLPDRIGKRRASTSVVASTEQQGKKQPQIPKKGKKENTTQEASTVQEEQQFEHEKKT